MSDEEENGDSGDKPTVMGSARPRAPQDGGDQPTVLPGAPPRPAQDSGEQPTVLPGTTPRAASVRGEEPTVMSGGGAGAPLPPPVSFPRRPKMTFPPETIVAQRYRIVRFIAKGGMGEVYEAEDLQLHDHVALKTVLPEIAEQENVLARFKREIQLARKVTHPNVCRIFDFGLHHGPPQEEGGEPLEVAFLTMELLPGESMTAMLRREGKRTPAQSLPLVAQMAAALGAAHRQGIVHRDFKSANVMLLQEPGGVRAVVTDFGLARRETSDGSLTGTGIVGTPDYMAPEQVEGGTISAATDIYALGVVLYEMVSSRMPFTAESALSIAVKRLSQPPEPLRPNVPDLDPAWEAAILRCLERSPAARYQSVEDLMRALTAATEPAPTPTVRQDQQKTRVVPPPKPPRPEPRPEPPKAGLPIAALAVGGLVLAGLVGGGLWWALGSKPEPTPSTAVGPVTTVTTVTPATTLPPVTPADPASLAGALEAFARGASYEVPVFTGQATYKVGEHLVVTVQIPRSGYLNLINIGEGEPEATVLFPNGWQAKNRFEAGTRETIGTLGDGRKLFPANLPGNLPRQQTLIVAIHTQQPLNGYEMLGDKAKMFSLLKGSDTGTFFAAARSGGEFGAGKVLVTITR